MNRLLLHTTMAHPTSHTQEPLSPRKMYVVKRSGDKEEIKFDKVTSRTEKLCDGLDREYVDPVAVTFKVNQGIYSGVTTVELDELAAQTSAYMSTTPGLLRAGGAYLPQQPRQADRKGLPEAGNHS